MTGLFEHCMARAWNALASRPARPQVGPGLVLGQRLQSDGTLGAPLVLAERSRCQHTMVLGKTGFGKSVGLRAWASQDIAARRGFVFFDLHGDSTGQLLQLIAEAEAASRQDLSDRLIVIDPADRQYSVGVNILERSDEQHGFVQIAECTEILKARCRLDSFGPRTEETLRASLEVLSAAGLTLLDLPRLLTDGTFRAACLRATRNPDVRLYFESRYNRASEAMQAVYRDALLNKIAAFTADPHFRHILGQPRSTISLLDAMDRGCWVLINLDKGRLGEQALTLGSLLLAQLKHALFARQRRSVFTLYCDEIQNLVAMDSSLDTLLAESRKFATAVVSANQFIDQYPNAMRAALAAVNSFVYFQLSAADAEKVASALDGGKTLATRLKNLPQRHFIYKSGSERWCEGVVPIQRLPTADAADLLARSRARYARLRTAIEADIAARQAPATKTQAEALHGWE